jgi:hypothetical protein
MRPFIFTPTNPIAFFLEKGHVGGLRTIPRRWADGRQIEIQQEDGTSPPYLPVISLRDAGSPAHQFHAPQLHVQ